VITEAALSGLPALGSPRGDIPEAFGSKSLLTPTDDAPAWAKLIRSLAPLRLADLVRPGSP
jgi:hypothetical protein